MVSMKEVSMSTIRPIHGSVHEVPRNTNRHMPHRVEFPSFSQLKEIDSTLGMLQEALLRACQGAGAMQIHIHVVTCSALHSFTS